MDITRSEDCLILYGLTPRYRKTKIIYSALFDFMKKKQEIDRSDRFNIIMFHKDGVNHLEYFTFDPYLILETLKSLEKSIGRPNITRGIFSSTKFGVLIYFLKSSESNFLNSSHSVINKAHSESIRTSSIELAFIKSYESNIKRN